MTTDKTPATLAVDVLAVMDDVAEVLLDERRGYTAIRLERALAAVAELIEAADHVHNAIRGHEDWGRLWSALARVKGESA